ncbi:MAG: hypothetical protein U0Q12_11635 [Vicinamibacterales bacterium]
MGTRIFGIVAGLLAFASAGYQYSTTGQTSYPLIVAGILAIAWFGFYRRPAS